MEKVLSKEHIAQTRLAEQLPVFRTGVPAVAVADIIPDSGTPDMLVS